MNITILTGRLTKDPEVKTTNNNKTVLSFSLAVDRGDKDRTTDFIDCVAWGSTADFIGKWFSKGSPLSVIGKVQTRTYEKDGQNIKRTEILVDKAEFVPKTNNASNNTERNTEASDEFGGLLF
jgi:single-strand DNA-binding protein